MHSCLMRCSAATHLLPGEQRGIAAAVIRPRLQNTLGWRLHIPTGSEAVGDGDQVHTPPLDGPDQQLAPVVNVCVLDAKAPRHRRALLLEWLQWAPLMHGFMQECLILTSV